MSVGRVMGVIAESLPHLSANISTAVATYSDSLIAKLGFDQAPRTRVEQYYIPLYAYLEEELKKLSTTPSPIIFGISAPQGCG